MVVVKNETTKRARCNPFVTGREEDPDRVVVESQRIKGEWCLRAKGEGGNGSARNQYEN